MKKFKLLPVVGVTAMTIATLSLTAQADPWKDESGHQRGWKMAQQNGDYAKPRGNDNGQHNSRTNHNDDSYECDPQYQSCDYNNKDDGYDRQRDKAEWEREQAERQQEWERERAKWQHEQEKERMAWEHEAQERYEDTRQRNVYERDNRQGNPQPYGWERRQQVQNGQHRNAQRGNGRANGNGRRGYEQNNQRNEHSYPATQSPNRVGTQSNLPAPTDNATWFKQLDRELGNRYGN